MTEKIKHHFIQQKYMKTIFGQSKFQIFSLDKYRNKNNSVNSLQTYLLSNIPTEEIFNSNLLLDNNSDSYWSNIEKNSFFSTITTLLSPNEFSQIHHFSVQQYRDLIEYFFMLIVRNSVEYWDFCARNTLNINNINILNLKKSINSHLIDKHITLVNTFYSYTTNNIINLKIRNLILTNKIDFIGEAVAIFFSTENINLKEKFYNALSQYLFTKHPKINQLEWLNYINVIFDLAILIPHAKVFIYIQNNFNNKQVSDEILQDVILSFYTSNLYLQKILMSSLNQLVVINQELAEHNFLNMYAQINTLINKNTPLYNIYNCFQKKIKQH